MVFGEERFVALLTDEVSAALVGVHVLLQVVGFEEVFVALGALDLPFTVRTRKQREVSWDDRNDLQNEPSVRTECGRTCAASSLVS